MSSATSLVPATVLTPTLGDLRVRPWIGGSAAAQPSSAGPAGYRSAFWPISTAHPDEQKALATEKGNDRFHHGLSRQERDRTVGGWSRRTFGTCASGRSCLTISRRTRCDARSPAFTSAQGAVRGGSSSRWA